MKILFISRAYPPVTGGIENQNYALSVWLPKISDCHTLANTHGKKFLPFFLPYAIIYTLIQASKYDAILLGDGVLAALGFIVKIFYPKKKIISIVHGLDLTYQNAFYQNAWVKIFLPSLDNYIAVSQETKTIALQQGLLNDKVYVIPNGTDLSYTPDKYTRQDLTNLLKKDTSQSIVLLTTGRLAKRKGAHWFIREILPTLPPHIFYVLAGDGPERETIEKALKELSLESRVILLGRVSDQDRDLLLHTADIFIQPNIPVPGDMEGFGIAVIEAALLGRPVIASELEGLKDAIIPNENGLLVPPLDTEAWRQAILELSQSQEKRLLMSQKAHSYTQNTFHWQRVSELYIEALENTKTQVQ
ncbi:MAG: glycosyltransferase family 4 protein [Candidatus Moranbacteria bacterium]|nr:glycosyltransferase family 4 protein [Candidatus Moranbacteria bacterium]